ncbi:MAG: 6-carboxytetrahydropterin synthase QueD [Eubacterium sp.]|nr:6-carboxytetrahydropterin synthase QueD [Eubacterium sp.]
MYTLQTKANFDSAHFLKGYDGKCSNLHGHRWTVEVELAAEKLQSEGQCRGMVMDFSDVKEVLRAEAKRMDHCLLIEQDSLRPATMAALKDENFRIVAFPFRPTAENFARYFFDYMKAKGCPVTRVRVYETPNNCASYSE